jgi:hypothetical protein
LFEPVTNAILVAVVAVWAKAAVDERTMVYLGL